MKCTHMHTYDHRGPHSVEGPWLWGTGQGCGGGTGPGLVRLGSCLLEGGWGFMVVLPSNALGALVSSEEHLLESPAADKAA